MAKCLIENSIILIPVLTIAESLGNIMRNTFYIIISLVILSCNHSENRNKNIYEIYNDCYAENVTVNKKSIRHYIKGFENSLIENKLLKDSTGKSYKDFFHEITDYDYIDMKSKYSFLDSLNGLEYDGVLDCPLAIRKHKDFDTSIFGKLKKYMTENGGNHEGYFESQPIDSIFNENTFKFDYIKHKLFNIIKVYDKTKNQKGKILYRKENYPKSVELIIDSNNNISWNNKVLELNELVKKASDYFSNYDKENVIFLKTSPQTS